MKMLFGLGLLAAISDVPPTEVRLFAMGTTQTTKGAFVMTPAAGEAVLAAFRESGMDRLPFDVGHGQVAGAGAHPEAHEALGWFLPEVRGDGLWATDIQWTDDGKAKIAARKFRFFSPAVMFDSTTRELRKLVNVALTNLPATMGQTPLVLDDTQQTEKPQMNLILAKLGAADEPTGLAAVVSLQTELLSTKAELATKQTELTSATTRLAELTAQGVKDKRDAKIATLTAEGKLPPAQKAFAESLSLEQLDSYAATLSVIRPATGAESASAGDLATLSDVDKQVCKVMGISEADYLASKKGGL